MWEVYTPKRRYGAWKETFRVDKMEDAAEDTLVTECFIVEVCEVLESIRV